MPTVFNAENKGHLTGHYPLFLGEDSGLYDSINITYPELERLYVEQMSQIWNEFEIDLSQDKMDMMVAPPDPTYLMVKTLSYQHLIDTVANRSIAPLLTRYATNSELEAMLNAQTLFETIHARTYSHIIKQTFTDPVNMLQDTYDDMDVLARSEMIIKVFDDLANLPSDADEDQLMEAIILAFVALIALEAISFMASFAVTFAITETGIFQGIGKNVALICRDEVLHARMDYAVLSILKNDPKWSHKLEELKPKIKWVLDAVRDQEVQASRALFSKGHKLVGINENILIDYVMYMSAPLYNEFGLEITEYDIPKFNPLPYMDKYISSTKIQNANMELENSNYKIGAVNDDTDSIDLDF